MAIATFQIGNVQIDRLDEPAGGPSAVFGDIISAPGIDAYSSGAFSIGTTNATAINIGHTNLSTYIYGDSLFVGGEIDLISAGTLNIGTSNATAITIGQPGVAVNIPADFTFAATHGTLLIGSNLQGASATANQFLKYQPAEEDSPPWAQYVVQYDNEFGSRKNHVMSFGWNTQPSGRVDETKSSFATVLESHYEPNSFTHQAEWYLSAITAAGDGYRPLAVDFPEDNEPLVRIAGQSLVLQDPATSVTRWSWGLNASAGGGAIVIPADGLSAVMQIQKNNIPLVSQYNTSNNSITLINYNADNELALTPTVRALGGLKSDGVVYFRDATGASIYAQTGFSGGVWSISSSTSDISINNGTSQVYVSPGAGTQLLYDANKVFVGSVNVEMNVSNVSAGQILFKVANTTRWGFGDGEGNLALQPFGGTYNIGSTTYRVGTVYSNLGNFVSGVQLGNTSGNKPSADINSRGQIYITQNITGVADEVEVCIKNDADGYEWASLLGGDGGSGGGETLAATYNLGSSSAHQTATIATAKGGSIVVKDDGSYTGSLLKITNSAGSTSFIDVATSATIFDTASDGYVLTKINGTQKLNIDADGVYVNTVLQPNTGDVFSLGTSSFRWADGYINNIVASTLIVDGYEIDPRGAEDGYVLKFDGTKFVPAETNNSSAYDTIQNDGVSVSQRNTINFSPRFVITDSENKTFVDLASDAPAGTYVNPEITVDAYGIISTIESKPGLYNSYISVGSSEDNEILYDEAAGPIVLIKSTADLGVDSPTFLVLQNPDDATSETPKQYSPALSFKGSGWNGTSAFDFYLSLVGEPVDEVGNKSRLRFLKQLGENLYYDGGIFFESTGKIHSKFIQLADGYDDAETEISAANQALIRYNHSITQLEYSVNGGGWTSFSSGSGVGGTIAANQIAYGSDTNTIQGSASLTYDGYVLTNTRNSIGTAQTHGCLIDNSTAATAGAQQYSPVLALLGRTWETTGSTSQIAGWGIQAQGTNNALATSNLTFYHNRNGTLTKAFHISATPNAYGGFGVTADSPTAGIKLTSGTGELAINNSVGAKLTFGSVNLTLTSSSATLNANGNSLNLTGGGLCLATASPTSWPHTVSTANFYIGVDAATAARTVNLPAATNLGATYVVFDRNNGAEANNITITPNGTNTINGTNASITINTNSGGYVLINFASGAWYAYKIGP